MRPALKVVMRNDGDFVDVILLYIGPPMQLIRTFVVSGSRTYWYHGTFSKVEQLHICGLSQRRRADRKAVCFWKVLRPSRSTTVFRGLPPSWCPDCTLHCLLLRLPPLPSRYLLTYILIYILTHLLTYSV